MVVLSAAVTTKNGKVLVSRQFVAMNRIRIEGLLAAFPKLLGTDSQHTFVETENVRYIYYPMDQLYLLLITNKQSNIMEDLDTLRLLAKVVPDTCKGHTEAAITENAFELVFAFDEVISIGIKENVTLEQIKTFCEMDSHEEKLQKIIQESKFNEAREEARRKAQTIDKKKAETKKLQGMGSGGGGGSYGGGGSDSGRYGGGSSGSGGGGGGSDGGFSSKTSTSTSSRTARKPESKAKIGGGMQLGKGKKKDESFFTALAKEEKLSGPRAPVSRKPGDALAAMAPDSLEKVFVSIEEKLTLQLERDGAVKKLDLKGEMKITIFDPDDSMIVVRTDGALSKERGFKSRLHPKINTKAYESDGILGLKDASKAFPVGTDNAPVILRWRLQTTEESEIPFTLNLWPNTEDGRSVVSIEFEHNKDGIAFSDVVISIPCPSSEPPEISQVEGEFKFDHKARALIWQIPEISADHSTGTLEFSVPEIDDDEFFPVNIQFSSPSTYAGMEVTGVTHSETGDDHEFTTSVRLVTDSFTID